MNKEVGSRWFKRLKKEIEAKSPHIRFKPIKFGFYRIFWDSSYIGECSKDMKEFGYDIEERNFQLESKKYFEEMEDNAELIQKIKNFREGYWDSRDRLITSIYLMKNNKDHRKQQQEAYREMRVK